MRKEIVVYTCGDSNDISTWSNVPYLFTRALEKRGYVLHRVDISPRKRINRIFNTVSFYLCRRMLGLRACPEFQRTWLHRFLTLRKIKSAAKQWDDTVDFHLFLSYAFYNCFSKRKSVLWCDWTDEIVIERLGRRPQWYERGWLKHERSVMRKADVVYSLFPVCAQTMTQMYGRPVLHLGRNVINCASNDPLDIDTIIEEKKQGNVMLFVGNHRYRGAAQELIALYPSLQSVISGLELHIVGMTAKELGVVGNGIYCHGYLHKNVDEERKLYYALMRRARLFVNPTPQWGGYSSTVEAMYYGCPVIVSPYDDFVSEFGNKIEFGRYVDASHPLHEMIQEIMKSDHYDAMAIAAHRAVKDYSWDNYIDVFLKSLEDEMRNC